MSKQRNDTKNKQEHPFLSAFLFTENGKPKSSFLIYTFCLSFVFLAVYVFIISNAITILVPRLDRLVSPSLNNTIVSAVSGIVGAVICCIPHHFFRDKRLVFGTHLWLALYVVASTICICIMARSLSFLQIIWWLAALPAAIGLALSYILFKRDYHPEPEKEPEPEWKKYVNRR